MRVIVTGRKDFEDAECVDRNLTELNTSTVLEGGARGADHDPAI